MSLRIEFEEEMAKARQAYQTQCRGIQAKYKEEADKCPHEKLDHFLHVGNDGVMECQACGFEVFKQKTHGGTRIVAVV